MTSSKVNGLEETDICSKGDPVKCCRASTEVAQVLHLHTTNESNPFRATRRCLTEGLDSQLRETVARQERRIQMLEKKVSCFRQLVWLRQMRATNGLRS